MLGELSDELLGKTIIQFVSTGPKSYSFKHADNKKNQILKDLH